MYNIHPIFAAALAPFVAPAPRSADDWTYKHLTYKADGSVCTLWTRIDGQGRKVFQITAGGPMDGRPEGSAGYQLPETALRVHGVSYDRPEGAASVVSYAPQVIADSSGQFVGNLLRFATQEEAERNVQDLSERWTLVRATRVVPSADPVTHAYIDGRLYEAKGA